MIVRSFRNCAILALFAGLLNAQVVFSRRVYSPQARTFQQIWNWDPSTGSTKRLTGSERNHFQPSCSSDGRLIYFLSGSDLYNYSELWTFEPKSGVERKVSADPKLPAAQAKQPPVAQCSHAVWSQDHGRFACSLGQDVLIYDGPTRKEIGRAHFTERSTAPNVIAWSPNRKWVLVRTQGQSDNSTARQSDYFVLDIGRMAWDAVSSGNDAMWVPGRNEIIYSTPRNLVPLTLSSKHQVWSSQLVVFDPATQVRTLVTSGISNNIQPAPCQP
jgi:hypothetical protein